MSNNHDEIEIPLGLGMALAQNPKAMDFFCSLTTSERRKIIEHTHAIHSKREMSEFVRNLTM